ncbi:SIR2 family protein [Clostridium sp. B9]|uniref:SIR2 family protein n=1 Tax=Clostridium sp. B9 TaxID=3423224 RepID=UPI003D2F508E
MSKSILDILIKKNEFPVIFIGSGISKRYLIGYPSWEELLEELWNKTGKNNFFGRLSTMREKLKKDGITEESELDFLVNTLIATEIEEKINEKFFSDKLEIYGLTQKEAYKNMISPFKKILSNRFSKYQVRESFKDELVEFRNMLMKSQIILSTNYDTFIEDEYNLSSKYGVKKYIGQQGFFKQTLGYAELYKIHGCTLEPNSLIINQFDYERFDKDSVLISAKIISMLLHSPIIFLGYSLTDRNIRKIIRDFTSSLSEDEKIELEKRLILVQWESGMKDIKEEVIIDKDLGCRLTVIKTDNFIEIYRKLARINQGVAPSEVRRYQHVIKQLIVERGKAGQLNTMLVSPSELDDIEKVIGNKNIVVAIGDSKIIFNMPNIVEYIYDYISENNEQNLDTMLRFIASQQCNSILPILKYVNEDNISKSSLHEKEKAKLRKRLSKQADLSVQLDALQYKKDYNRLDEIINGEFAKYKEYSLIAYNFDKIGIDNIKKYILKEVKMSMDSGEITIDTGLRRLALIYDLKNSI